VPLLTCMPQTFYVTLDLSKADFKAQDQIKSQFPNSQNQSELLDESKVAEQGSQKGAPTSAGGSDADRDEEDQPSTLRKGNPKRPPNGRDEDNDGDDDDDDGDGDGNGDRNAPSRETVQILDLHTENPIISYKGRVFSGQWCENTTTELLMTRHDSERPLPSLRRLDDNKVDLLAASSARINVTEQKIKPKIDRTQSRASAHLPQTVIPPVDLKASQERIDQRNFLADLIALKRRKGETDDVTIIARSMQGKGKGKDTGLNAKAKGVRTHRRGRWATTSQLHAVREGVEERPRRAGRKRAAGRGKWALFSLEDMRDYSVSIASSVADSPAEGGESTISTPTPFQWDELGDERDGSPADAREAMEVEGEDEQGEDELDYDDNEEMDEDEGDEEAGEGEGEPEEMDED